MGCGTSRVSEQAVEPSFGSGESKAGVVIAEAGEPSLCRSENFDCDPEDEASAATSASKAVNLIIRAYSPVSLPNAPAGDEEEDEDEEEEEEKQVLKAMADREEKPLCDDAEDVDDDDDDEVLEDASSETIVSPVKSPDVCKEYQGVDDALPKAAAAALEAIVKSAEDDVQAMKVVAAVAAVGDILFGGKDETDVKLEKCQTFVKTLAEVDASAINSVLKGDATQTGFLLTGTPRSKQVTELKQHTEFQIQHTEQQQQQQQQIDELSVSTGSPKSSFLFDYCQKLSLHSDYRISPPSTSSTSSEADTLSMVQEFLEEIDLTKEFGDLPPTPRIAPKSKHLYFCDPGQV